MVLSKLNQKTIIAGKSLILVIFYNLLKKILGVFCLIAILLQIVPKSIGGVPERYDLNLTILPFNCRTAIVVK